MDDQMDGPIDGPMNDRHVVITGANTGIGKEAAVVLAGMGAHVIGTSRDEERGKVGLAEIRERSGRDDVEMLALDLASFASIRAFADTLLDRPDGIDVLVNNAGGVLSDRRETAEGFEMTFGVNHLGHFLLTELLAERLRASAPSRVVVVSSQAHTSARDGLDFDDLQSERRYRPFLVYARSKLANILFTRELARRLDGSGVTANSLHPGFVRSDFGLGGDMSGIMTAGFKLVARPFAISPARGARTTVYLASSPDVADVSGWYFSKSAPASTSKAAEDDDAARRLWEVSDQLVASAQPT
jgi:NAD(P)-dependent dehydrogenase (short-subunit alcohol dehydrogenase family)